MGFERRAKASSSGLGEAGDERKERGGKGSRDTLQGVAIFVEAAKKVVGVTARDEYDTTDATIWACLGCCQERERQPDREKQAGELRQCWRDVGWSWTSTHKHQRHHRPPWCASGSEQLDLVEVSGCFLVQEAKFPELRRTLRTL